MDQNMTRFRMMREIKFQNNNKKNKHNSFVIFHIWVF